MADKEVWSHSLFALNNIKCQQWKTTHLNTRCRKKHLCQQRERGGSGLNVLKYEGQQMNDSDASMRKSAAPQLRTLPINVRGCSASYCQLKLHADPWGVLKVDCSTRKFMMFSCTGWVCGYFVPQSVFFFFFILSFTFLHFSVIQIPPSHLCASFPSFQIPSCCVMSCLLLTSRRSLSKTSQVPKAHWDQTVPSDLW